MIEVDGLKLLDVQEIVEKTNMDTQTVRRWIRDKELFARKIGRKYYVETEELMRFLKSGTTFNWRAYTKKQAEKHMTNLDEILKNDWYNKELLHHLEYFFYAFPSTFEELPIDVQDYYHRHVDRFIKERKDAGTTALKKKNKSA